MFSQISERQKKKPQKNSKTKKVSKVNARLGKPVDSERQERTCISGNSDRQKEKDKKKKKSKSDEPRTMMQPVTTMVKLTKKSSRSKRVPPEQQELSEQHALSPGENNNRMDFSKEKWQGEDTSRMFVERIDPNVARSEYLVDIKNIIIDRNRCEQWNKNMRKNQDPMYPCYDTNLVRNPNAPDDYINATAVTVTNLSKPIILGQMPLKHVEGAIEEFWKTIFNEHVMLIHILTGDDEVVDFFPQVANAFEHYGSMFVNNRKVEKPDEESVRFSIEILPTGFSNSNICSVVLHFGWQSHNVPAKFGKTMKSCVEVYNFLASSMPDEKAMIISKHGAGRAGFFLSLTSAVAALNQKEEPRVLEIVKSVRSQRPNAVESLKQYTSIYLCLVYYIKKKVGDPQFAEKVKNINESFKNMLEGAGASVMQ